MEKHIDNGYEKIYRERNVDQELELILDYRYISKGPIDDKTIQLVATEERFDLVN